MKFSIAKLNELIDAKLVKNDAEAQASYDAELKTWQDHNEIFSKKHQPQIHKKLLQIIKKIENGELWDATAIRNEFPGERRTYDYSTRGGATRGYINYENAIRSKEYHKPAPPRDWPGRKDLVELKAFLATIDDKAEVSQNALAEVGFRKLREILL